MQQAQAQNNIDLNLRYHEGQDELFFRVKAKKKVIAKGRRVGFTQGGMQYAIETLADGIGPGLWVDTINSNIDRYVERYGYPVLNQIPSRYWMWRQQKKELDVFGQKLDMRSADQPERIEGFGYKFIILNEAGIILRNEYLWNNAIQPMMLDFNPDVIIGGTPKGKGLFHQLYQWGQDPLKPDWWSKTYSSFDNPFLSQDDLQALVDEIPASVQKQEIYGEFCDDSSTVFRNLKACSSVAGPQDPIFQAVYRAGLDLARLQDFTVLTILDKDGRQVFMDRFQHLDWSVQVNLIATQVKRYNNARLYVDSTGVGDPILEDLKQAGLDVHGHRFDNTFKSQIVNALMMALEKQDIAIFNGDENGTPEGKVQMSELQIFEYEITKTGLVRYNAPPGFHDDCVIALALANWNRNQVPVNLAIFSQEAVY